MEKTITLSRKRKKALKLAIKSLDEIATTYYGWSAKFHKKARKKWNEYQEAIQIFYDELNESEIDKDIIDFENINKENTTVVDGLGFQPNVIFFYPNDKTDDIK